MNLLAETFSRMLCFPGIEALHVLHFTDACTSKFLASKPEVQHGLHDMLCQVLGDTF